jgi:hypothetical protein
MPAVQMRGTATLAANWLAELFAATGPHGVVSQPDEACDGVMAVRKMVGCGVRDGTQEICPEMGLASWSRVEYRRNDKPPVRHRARRASI